MIVVVDMVRAFVGDPDLSEEASMSQWPLSCGESGWAATKRLEQLLSTARAHAIPVVYTTVDGSVLGGATRAAARRGSAGCGMQDIPDSVAPSPHDVVLAKERPSAFFATPLAALLVRLGADCLIVCGTTTSGCVRATVVDGFSMGWRVLVAEDGCFDRALLSHDVALFELNAKYATVVPVHELAVALALAEPGSRGAETCRC